MAKCNPGWVYGCHDVKGYGGKVQNVCGCIEASKKTSSPAPKPKQTTSSNPPTVRNNKPLQSRFEGTNPQTFNKLNASGSSSGGGTTRGSSISSNPVIRKIADNPTVRNIQNTFDLPDWAIPAGIVGVVVIVILLLVIR